MPVISETAFALIIAAFLALLGLGVAVLTVPNHPDRAKWAKIFFSAAGLVFAGTTIYWTIFTSKGLLARIAIDLVAFGLVVLGLVAGFRFASRSVLSELQLPASAFVSQPFWPEKRRLIGLITVGILAVVFLINWTRELAKSATWSSIPWRWIVPSVLTGIILGATVRAVASRKRLTSAVPNHDECQRKIGNLESTVARLKEHGTTQAVQIGSRDGQIKQLQQELDDFKWLTKADEDQRKHLKELVLVEKCEINSSYFAKGKLYLEFTFYIVNYSMFEVSVPLPADTQIPSIRFKGDLLSGVAKLVENRVKNSPTGDRSHFIVRQWVSSDEAKDIGETLEKAGNLFDFSKTIVPIKGGDEFPDVEETELDLTRAMQNADLENKLVVLRNENSRLSEGLALWHERSRNIEALTLALGAFYRAYNQLEQNETLSGETGNSLRWRFLQALHDCHEYKLEDEYYDTLPPFPDSMMKQREWVDSLCTKLRSFIVEQREGLSDFVPEKSADDAQRGPS